MGRGGVGLGGAAGVKRGVAVAGASGVASVDKVCCDDRPRDGPCAVGPIHPLLGDAQHSECP